MFPLEEIEYPWDVIDFFLIKKKNNFNSLLTMSLPTPNQNKCFVKNKFTPTKWKKKFFL